MKKKKILLKEAMVALDRIHNSNLYKKQKEEAYLICEAKLLQLVDMLRNKKYEYSEHICESIIRNISRKKYYCDIKNEKIKRTKYVLGLLKLYKLYSNKKSDKISYNSIFNKIIIEYELCGYATFEMYGKEYLEVYKKYLQTDGNNYRKQGKYIFKYKKISNVVLSNIYCVLADIKGKNNEENKLSIKAAQLALKQYPDNYDAYYLLASIHSIMGNKKNEIDTLKKLFDRAKNNWSNGMKSLIHLASAYTRSNKLKDACYCTYQMTRLCHYNVWNSSEPEKNGNSIANNNVNIDEQILHSKYLFETTGHYLATISYWSEEDFTRASRHLLKLEQILTNAKEKLIKSGYIDYRNRTQQILIEAAELSLYLLQSILTIDIKINKFAKIKYDDISTLYNRIAILENDINIVFDDLFYKRISKILLSPGPYDCFQVTFAKRLYLLVLYSSLNKKINPEWSENKYILKLLHQMTKHLTNDETWTTITEIKRKINEVVINISKEYRPSTNPSLFYGDLLNLTRDIFNKYGFINTLKSVNDLESFIIDLYQCKTQKELEDKSAYLINRLMPSLCEIDGKLATGYSDINKIFNQLSSISSQVQDIGGKLDEVPKMIIQAQSLPPKTNMPVCKPAKANKKKHNWIIMVNSRLMKINDLNKLIRKRERGEIDIWVNCMTEELWLYGKEIEKVSQPQLKIIALLLNNTGNTVSYDDLIRCLPAGDKINDVHKIMKRIKDKIGLRTYNKYIKPIKKTGYMIKGNPAFCLIDNDISV